MGRRILVVEPDDTLRGEVCAYLLSRGHRVERVSSPREALVRVSFARFDAVLLNVDAPGGRGLRAVRDLAGGGAPPAVVAVSGSVWAGAEAVRAGARRFLLRPYAFPEVEEALCGPPGGAVGGEGAASLPRPPGVARRLH